MPDTRIHPNGSHQRYQHTPTAKALLAATLACLMTACIAGAFYSEGSILFGSG